MASEKPITTPCEEQKITYTVRIGQLFDRHYLQLMIDQGVDVIAEVRNFVISGLKTRRPKKTKSKLDETLIMALEELGLLLIDVPKVRKTRVAQSTDPREELLENIRRCFDENLAIARNEHDPEGEPDHQIISRLEQLFPDGITFTANKSSN